MNEHRPDREPLDEFLAALRSEARADEVVGEASIVEAMSSALLSPEAHNVTRLSSRTPRIAAIVAASVLAVGGLAAAAPGKFLPPTSNAPFAQAPPASRPPVELPPSAAQNRVDASTTSSTTTSSTTTTTTTSVVDEGASDVAPVTESSEKVDDPTTAFDETQCADGNHGKTVSSVAHSVAPGPDHGAAVSEAAQSSCGKTSIDPDSTEVESDVEAEADADADADAEESQDDQTPAQPGDKGKARGHGQDKNNGADKRSDKGANDGD